MGNLIAVPHFFHSMTDALYRDKELDQTLEQYQQRVQAEKTARTHSRLEAEARERSESNVVSRPSQVLPYLYVGDRAAVRDVEQLRRLRIGHIIQLNPVETVDHVNQVVSQLGCLYTRLPVEDNETYNVILDFPKTNKIIGEARDANTRGDPTPNVLIFCEEGVSRSPTIVLAYLIKRGWTLTGAISLMRQNHPTTFPNKGFFNQLLEEEKTQLKQNSLQASDYPKIFE